MDFYFKNYLNDFLVLLVINSVKMFLLFKLVKEDKMFFVEMD